MKLRHKFILGFFPLLVIISIFGVAGIRTFFSVNQLISNLKQDIAPSAFAVLEFKDVLGSFEAAINARSIDRVKTEEQITKLKSLIRRHMRHEDPEHALSPKTVQQMRRHAVTIMELARYLLNLKEHGWQDSEELDSIRTDIRQEQLALGLMLDEHLALHMQALSNAEKIISDRYRQGTLIITGAIVAGFFIAVYTIVSLIRTVLTPIRILREGAKEIGNGRLDYEFRIETGDEFEELAEEFKSMAEKLAESYRNLDSKVLARTLELSKTNDELKKEIQERALAEEEQKRAETLVHTLTQELIKVQEIERKRIALDLHDNVAQDLSALKVMSETLFIDQVFDRDQLQRKLAEWSKVLKQCIGSVRELSYDLRPPILEQMGIKSALAEYCREFTKKNNMIVDFSSTGMDALSMSLDYDIAINLYRIVQEALNNTKKHACASLAKVRLVASGSTIVLQIEDNGQGCDLAEARQKVVSEKRLGLLGMEERVKFLGGIAKISSSTEEGTRIFIEIPSEKRNDSEKKNNNY